MNIIFKITSVLSVILLVACGDENSNSVSEEKIAQSTQNQITYKLISGTAFSTSTLNGANVTAICKDGLGFKNKVIVNAQGQWQGEIDTSKFPCRLEAKAEGQTYHSYIDHEGRVNINPLTDMVVAYASNQVPVTWYQSGSMTTEKLNSANSALVAELIKKGYGINNDMDLFTAEMKANNPIHQAIQELLEAIQNNRNIKDYDALLMLVKDGNLSQVPEKIEFLNNSVAKVFGFNKDACQVLPKTENTEQYNKCSDKVIDDFSESNLVATDSDEKCILVKQGNKVSFTKGNQTVSALLDKEQEDGMDFTFDEGELEIIDLIINTGPYTDINTYSQIGLSFSSDGKLRAVVGKSPIVSSMNCASPEFKKFMELYK
ncbi:hypothetical protein [Acinetobacter baumannii]|uniref:hypothetical protein n=1 Tax=Acinetobacter baumannii TaxID=470 RepID=UPI00044D1B3A|nr:hypothetical protein [Acinetobacter baumannii]EXR47966.1 hypothetical protein J661_2211 [Acinetobacter baumannii 1391434]